MKLINLLEIMMNTELSTNSNKIYFVGGFVREKFLNQINSNNSLSNINDADFCNGSKNINTFAQQLYKDLTKFNPTTKTMSDGHISIFMGNLKLDFSSNFILPDIEKYIGKKSPLEQEIYSRDFTCNTLLMPLDLKTIYDPTKQGFIDIKNKIIKTCLSPEVTLTNSRNRVVRAIYLACKLDFTIDQSIIDYVKSNPESVKIASEKTLKEKLDKAFELDADKASKYISEMNLWKHIPISKKLYPYYTKALVK